MGFYIEELPTEFNGITMQEADYLADEFLKDTPCNRMWDAMRALRDFYETVTSEAVDLADRKTENCSEKPNNCEDLQDWKDRMWAEAIVTEPTISKMEQVDKDINVRSKDEPQTDGILFKGNLKEGDYKLIKTINGWVLEGDIAYYGEPQTERSE